MIRALLITFILTLTIQARENPFFPTKGEVDIPFTSNAKSTLDPLKRATIDIPSNARVIKKVTIDFINLDGTTSSKDISINNSVDWHLPIFISQSIGKINSANKNKISTKRVKSVPAAKPKNKHFTKIYNLGFITFYKKGKELKITTKDLMVRDFLLTSPHRIVLDFKKDLDIKTKIKTFNSRYFKKISFGAHKDYYRVVIELDCHYRYKKETKKKAYILSLY